MPSYIQGKKIIKDTNINIVKEFIHVPWIALKYFEPYIITNTDIIIQYYITDHAHNVYIANNTYRLFKVIVEFNGTIITDVVSSGNNTINIRSSSHEGETYFTIKCVDLSNNVESPIM